MSRNFLPRIVLLTLIPYMLLFGAAFNGVIFPMLQVMHLAALAIGLGVWAAARTVGGWKWHPTALDGVIWLWVAAIAIAALANPDTIRRSQPALWFLTALIIGWYVIHDALSNGAFTRAQIIDMMLMVGVVWFAFGVRELFDPDLTRDGLFGLPRIGSITGNPNLLSAVLVPLIGVAFGRAWVLHGMGRVLLWGYVGVALACMILTYSRGGWVGMAAVIGMGILLVAADRGWATPAGARAAWRSAKAWQKAFTILFITGTLVSAIVVGVVLLDSLDDRGRTADLRTYLWEAAWDSFTEKPVTGHGLYTMPRLILERSSVPPRTAQPHAHNFPLQVLAEMGIPGGIAMIASLYAVLRAGTRAWQSASTRRERHLIAAGWAASVGFGVHNLFDLTAWTPFVTFAGLLVLMVMTAPPMPVPYPARRGRFAAGAVYGVALVLVVTGIYSHTQYAQYDAIIKLGREPGQRLEAAAELDGLIGADPRQPVYRWTQGILYGSMAYSTQDAALAQRAIQRFSEAGELGMDSAVLRLNLAALSAQIGDMEAVATHLERMAEYAPESTLMLANAALAAERWGLPDTARSLWARLLLIENIDESNVALMPEIAGSTVAQEFEMPPLFEEGAATALLAAGRNDEAAALLEAHPEWRSSTAHALRALAAHRLGQDPAAALAAADKARRNSRDLLWLMTVTSMIEGTGMPVQAVRTDPESLDITDEGPSAILARLHFFRQIFNRMIVPQAGYDRRDFGIAALMG